MAERRRCPTGRWAWPWLLCTAWLLLPAAGWAAAGSPGGDFTLTDHNGQPYRLSRARGRVVILFFGYTRCPDVCPTGLATLSHALRDLEALQIQVQALFVSLDPEHDTPAILRDYVRYFSPDLIGLTGSPAEIATVAGMYRVSHTRRTRGDGGYTLDHTASYYLLDPRGKLAAIVPFGLPPEHIVSLVRNLLRETR